MSTDPEILSSSYVPGDPLPEPPAPPAPDPALNIEPYARPRRIPNLGHTILFFLVAIIVLLLTSVSAFALVMGLHLLGAETPEQLLREPRLLIPSMAAGYLIAGAIVWAIFTYLWQQPFPQGLRWNFSVVRRHWVPLLAGGVVLSLAVQFLSNFLPIPKTLPIDDFFRTPADVWMVALFGTFLAPVCEELAFRGFLLPSLASAWDWFRGLRPLSDVSLVASDRGRAIRSPLEHRSFAGFLHHHQHCFRLGPRRSASPRLGAVGGTVRRQPGALRCPAVDPFPRRQHHDSRHL